MNASGLKIESSNCENTSDIIMNTVDHLLYHNDTKTKHLIYCSIYNDVKGKLHKKDFIMKNTHSYVACYCSNICKFKYLILHSSAL